MTKLAIDGGIPIRRTLLPYGRHHIDETDINAVVATLRSDWLTTGPRVQELEKNVAEYLGVPETVAVSSGTAALHTMMAAINLGPGDEVIVPTMTFAATANAIVYQGAIPVFADINADTLLIDESNIEKLITKRTKAIVAVDYAGQPCNYKRLNEIAQAYGLTLLDDACHALGATYNGIKVGAIASLTAFSFHPVKHITSGEGGLIATLDSELADKMRRFRNHGISTDFRQREQRNTWYYEMTDLGYNYRITDIQCALGISQLKKADQWLKRRSDIAAQYNESFSGLQGINLLETNQGCLHAYHLYVIKIDDQVLRVDRSKVYSALRAEGIGVNVHYLPVHLHPFYRHKYSAQKGLCPEAERAYQSIISLPIFPSMTDEDMQNVIDATYKVVEAYRI